MASFSIIDILKVDENTLKRYSSTFAFYTGLMTKPISLETSFNYLYEKNFTSVVLSGTFTIKHIEILNKSSVKLIPGYHAVVYIQANTTIEELKKYIQLDEKGNNKGILEFSTKPPKKNIKIITLDNA